jgi:uncharacterized membrane protein YdbT with pleckstrin-like domain
MSYVARVLQPGETVLYQTKLHWWIYLPAIGPLILSAALGVGSFFVTPELGLAMLVGAGIFLLLAIPTFLRGFIARATTELAVTDHRVIYKKGLFARHTIEMNRDKVESVDVDQTVPGRILGYGTIIVRGTGGSLEPIRNIRHPLTFRSHITAGPATQGAQG